MRKQIIAFSFLILVSFYIPFSSAKTIYVDGALQGGCAGGSYSIAARDCSGSDGMAWNTLQEGFSNLNDGDTLYIRGGTYANTAITWNANYNNMTTVSGYGNETAILSQPKSYIDKIALSQDANNITIKNLTFLGARYNPANTESWTSDGNGVYHVNYYSGMYIGSDAIGWHEGAVMYNGNGPCSDAVTAVAAGSDGDIGWCQGKTYVKSTTDPSLRTDLVRSSWGISIGSGSSGTGYVVIDNCIFNGTGHAHLKGGYRWWIKNNRFSGVSAGDANDHDMYVWSNFSPGNEAIIENNYFESPWAGGAVHIYSGGGAPGYYIVRNNIFNGKPSDSWCIALWAGHSTVVGNTCYGTYKGMEIGESSPYNDYNVVENNIFYEYSSIGAAWSNGINGNPPINNLIFRNNIVYSDVPGSLHFYDPVGTGNIISGNIINAGPSLIQANPAIWSDFRLQPSSMSINNGINLGAAYHYALDPNNTSWPPSIIDQNTQGSGWEIGAFAFVPAGASCIHKSEIPPCDGCVSMPELNAFISRWKISNADVTLKELIDAIGLWKKACA